MNRQTRQLVTKTLTKVTTTQLLAVLLFMGLLASVLASFALGAQDQLRGGVGRWGVLLLVIMTAFTGTALGYLRFRQQARQLALKPQPTSNPRLLFPSKP